MKVSHGKWNRHCICFFKKRYGWSLNQSYFFSYGHSCASKAHLQKAQLWEEVYLNNPIFTNKNIVLYYGFKRRGFSNNSYYSQCLIRLKSNQNTLKLDFLEVHWAIPLNENTGLAIPASVWDEWWRFWKK